MVGLLFGMRAARVKMMPFEALTFDPARGVVKGPRIIA
jgi:hypothetical protein